MKYILLERRSDNTYEQIKLFEDFISHYTEGDGFTKTVTETYMRMGVGKEDCLRQYIKQGYTEVENGC